MRRAPRLGCSWKRWAHGPPHRRASLRVGTWAPHTVWRCARRPATGIPPSGALCRARSTASPAYAAAPKAPWWTLPPASASAYCPRCLAAAPRVLHRWRGSLRLRHARPARPFRPQRAPAAVHARAPPATRPIRLRPWRPRAVRCSPASRRWRCTCAMTSLPQLSPARRYRPSTSSAAACFTPCAVLSGARSHPCISAARVPPSLRIQPLPRRRPFSSCHTRSAASGASSMTLLSSRTALAMAF